jgi:hypothetical protein
MPNDRMTALFAAMLDCIEAVNTRPVPARALHSWIAAALEPRGFPVNLSSRGAPVLAPSVYDTDDDEPEQRTGLVMSEIDLRLIVMEYFVKHTEAMMEYFGTPDNRQTQPVLDRIEAYILYGKLDGECAASKRPVQMCEDCPPAGYPTDDTRCGPCPLRSSFTSDV